MCHQGTWSPGFGRKMTSPWNCALGKCLSESLGGYLKPAALSPGSGWCSVELALNSCCAYCDKIERGIERSRRHNKPVFHPAEHRVPAANLDFIAPWYLEWEILKLGSVFAFVSLLRKNKISPWTLLYLRNIFACYVFFMDNRITQDSWIDICKILFSSEQGRRMSWAKSLELQKCFFVFASFAISAITTTSEPNLTNHSLEYNVYAAA